MPPPTDVLPIARAIRNSLDRPMSLHALARRAGRSPFHLQRVFRSVTGESPKQYALRLRIERAAAALASSNASVLGAALANGFASPEVFVRAFRRLFGQAPSGYRRHALRDASQQTRRQHRILVENAGPCINMADGSLMGAASKKTGDRRQACLADLSRRSSSGAKVGSAEREGGRQPRLGSRRIINGVTAARPVPRCIHVPAWLPRSTR